MMMQPTVVRKGQRKRTLPALIALCRLQMAKAAAGDTKAFQAMINLASWKEMFHDLPATEENAQNEEPVQELGRPLSWGAPMLFQGQQRPRNDVPVPLRLTLAGCIDNHEDGDEIYLFELVPDVTETTDGIGISMAERARAIAEPRRS